MTVSDELKTSQTRDAVSAPDAKPRKPNREQRIRADMESLGVYSPAFDNIIHALAVTERRLSRAEKDWKKHGGLTVSEQTNRTGAKYTAKDPYYTVVESLRRDVTALQNQLGLTPAGLARARTKKNAASMSGASLLDTLLEDAHAYALDNAAQFQNDVDSYVNGVLSGEIIACREIVQACERYQRDLQNTRWDFRPEPANEIIAIIETTICHKQGEFLDASPLRGTPFFLLPYHKFIIYNLFGFYLSGTKERRFKEALDFVPRKNVKTTFAVALAWAIGLHESKSGSKVYEIAGSLAQAMIGFDFLKYNLRRLHITTDDDPISGLRVIDNNIEHSISGDVGEDGNIEFRAVAAAFDKLDGFNANIVIADEAHTYKNPANYKVMLDACKAYTNRLAIIISSGGKLAQGFLAKRVEYCKKILDGIITGPEADSIFVFIAAAPMDDNGEVDYTNPDVLQGCNPGWGHSIRPNDMINDAAQARDDPQLRPEFLNKSLNVFTAALRAWFDIEEFRRSDLKYNWTLEQLRKLPVKWYGGTDLSKLHDLTAACLFGNYKGVDIIVTHCWFPRVAAVAKAQEDQIPLFGWQEDGWLSIVEDATLNYADVVEWYKARRKEGFNIRKIGHDRRFAREYYLAMKREKFSVKDQPQLPARKSEGFRYLEASAKRGTLYYLHAEPFEYCVQNVKAVELYDDMIKYEKIAPHLRIDAFDCAVFAACAYLEDLEPSAKAANLNAWFGLDSKTETE